MYPSWFQYKPSHRAECVLFFYLLGPVFGGLIIALVDKYKQTVLAWGREDSATLVLAIALYPVLLGAVWFVAPIVITAVLMHRLSP